MWRRRIRDIHRLERKVYSQNGEDGVIAGIFRKIGAGSRRAVEFGVQDGTECNTRLLAEQGWTTLMMDADPASPRPIAIERITAENINDVFARHDVPRDLELLSIDIDTNDYWVWQALDPSYRPRLVVIEYNAQAGPTSKVSVAYDPELTWDGTSYFGASLQAMAALGRTKGYTLVGCESNGVNAFFVRDDFAHHFRLRPVEQLYVPPGYGEFRDGAWSGHPPSERQLVPVDPN